MEKIIGSSFEELDNQEMINIQGGATPSTATTLSSLPCAGASLLLSAAATLVVTATALISKG